MSEPRIRIVGGGRPTPAELAAIVVALTPVGVEERTGSGPPPWRRAAILEGLGREPVSSAADIAARPGWRS